MKADGDQTSARKIQAVSFQHVETFKKKTVNVKNRQLSGSTTAITFSTFITQPKSNYASQSRIPSAKVEEAPVLLRVQSGLPMNAMRTHLKRIQSAVPMRYQKPQDLQTSQVLDGPLELIKINDEDDGELQRNGSQQTFKMPSMLHSVSSQQSGQRLIVTEANLDSPEILKRMKFDPDIKTQVLRVKIGKIADRNLRNMLAHITMKQRSLVDAVKNQQTYRCLDILQEFAEYSFSTQSTVILLEVLQFSGLVCENVLEYNFAVFFYNQMRTICNYSRRMYDDHKIKGILGLAMCCFHHQRYEDAIKFLKKCLQYAWAAKNVDDEIEIYDRLSLCYFYLGYLTKSQFYHERAITYDYELDSSPLKEMSTEILRIYLEKNYLSQLGRNLNISLLSKLELPVNNDLIHQEVPDYDFCPKPTMTMQFGGLRSYPQSRVLSRHSSKLNFKRQDFYQTPTLKAHKGYNDLLINGQDLLNQYLHDKEFEYLVHTPKHSYRSQAECFDLLKAPKKKDNFHDPKMATSRFSTLDLKVINQFNAPNPLEDPLKYNLPLPKKIEVRLKKQFNLTLTLTNIHHQVGINNNQFSDRVDKIQINHKSQQRESESKVLNQKKRLQNINTAYSEMIYKLLALANQK